MAIEAERDHKGTVAEDRPFAHLQTTPEERARILAKAPPPRSLEEWLGPPSESPEEDKAELEWFLREREAQQQHDLKRMEEGLKELDE